WLREPTPAPRGSVGPHRSPKDGDGHVPELRRPPARGTPVVSPMSEPAGRGQDPGTGADCRRPQRAPLSWFLAVESAGSTDFDAENSNDRPDIPSAGPGGAGLAADEPGHAH